MVLPSFLLWTLSACGLLTLVTKKRVGYIIPVSLICEVLFFYAFAFFNKLKLGFYFTCLVIPAFFIYLLILFIKKEKDVLNVFKDNFLTIELFVFIAFSVYFYFLFKLQGFSFCDEFTHWGQMVKETLKYDGFYAQSSNEWLRHKDYPPFFSLLESFWCLLGGKFSETYCFMAVNTFLISLLMPIYTKLNIKNNSDWLKAILISCSSVLLLLTISRTETASDYAHVLNSVYTDWCLAAFTAYSFFIVLSNKDYSVLNIINILLCGISLLLMKQMGLPFFLLVIMLYFLKAILIDKKNIKKNILLGLFVLILPFMIYFSWKYIINFYGVASTSQFSVGQIKILDTLSILKGQSGNEWQRDAFKAFIYALLKRPLVTNPINITYFVYVGIISLIILLSFRNKQSFITVITYAFGSVAYAGTMLLLYMFSFSSEEASSIASFDRYMMTYLFIGSILAFILLTKHIIEINKKTTAKLITILLVIFAFTEKEELYQLIPKTTIDNSQDFEVLVLKNQDDYFSYERENLNGLRYNFTVLNYDELPEDSSDIDEILSNYQLIYNIGFDQKLYDNYWSSRFNTPYYADTTYEIKNGDKIEINYIEFQYLARVLRYYINSN